MLSDRQGLLLVDIAGRGCVRACVCVCVCVWDCELQLLKVYIEEFSMDLL